MRTSFGARLALAAALVAGAAGGAHADVIDGNWCSGDGRHFSINGPSIVTPGGAKTQGNYSRHAFSYTAPPNEDSAGAQIFMTLLNETTVRLRVGADPTAPTQIWKRCDVVS
jgi:hypothetical protein